MATAKTEDTSPQIVDKMTVGKDPEVIVAQRRSEAARKAARTRLAFSEAEKEIERQWEERARKAEQRLGRILTVIGYVATFLVGTVAGILITRNLL